MAHRPRARARAVVRTLAGRGRGLHDRRAVHAVAADAAAAQRAVDRTAAAGACRPVAGLGPAGGAHVGRGCVPDVRQPEQRAVSGAWPRPTAICLRSEEHTSELQSLLRSSYAVFCLTKKTNRYNNPTTQSPTT